MLKDEYEELESTPTKRLRSTGDSEAPIGDDEGPEDLSYRVWTFFSAGYLSWLTGVLYRS